MQPCILVNKDFHNIPCSHYGEKCIRRSDTADCTGYQWTKNYKSVSQSTNLKLRQA